jgi:hypothetical protein
MPEEASPTKVKGGTHRSLERSHCRFRFGALFDAHGLRLHQTKRFCVALLRTCPGRDVKRIMQPLAMRAISSSRPAGS